MRIADNISDKFTIKFIKRLLGKKGIEGALGRLDKLTREEFQTAIAEILKVTHDVEGKVDGVDIKVQGIDGKVDGVSKGMWNYVLHLTNTIFKPCTNRRQRNDGFGATDRK